MPKSVPVLPSIVRETLSALEMITPPLTGKDAEFLESFLRQRYPLRPKQLAVLATMAKHYLPESGLEAELLGQQRLF